MLGRKTYEGLAGYWPSRSGRWADMVNPMPKCVGSTTLSGDLEWNATLLERDLEDSIPRLKDEVDGDLFPEAERRGRRRPVHARERRVRVRPKAKVGGRRGRPCGEPVADGMLACCRTHRTVMLPTVTPGIYARGSRYVVVWEHRGRQHKKSYRTLTEAREAKGRRQAGDRKPATRQLFEDYAPGSLAMPVGRAAVSPTTPAASTGVHSNCTSSRSSPAGSRRT